MPPPAPDPERVLDALVRHVRPVVLTAFHAQSCIASTRIGLDALAYFGVGGREYPLSVAAFNAEAAELLAGGLTPTELGAVQRDLDPASPGGPWSVGLGGGPGEGGWSGHLILGCPQLGVVADLSADQASRPHKGLPLPPWWARLPEPGWFTDPAARTLLHRADGVLLLLDRGALADPDGYRASPNWQRRGAGAGPELYRRLTGQVIRAMRADLDR